MKFWDSSALVPLFVEQATSKPCRQLLRSDRQVIVSWFTRTEIISALQRLRRERRLSGVEVQSCERRLDRLTALWTEVQPTDAVRDTAERLLRTHELRAADALQLGAALVVVDLKPKGRVFVTLHDALAVAAAAEGYDVRCPA